MWKTLSLLVAAGLASAALAGQKTYSNGVRLLFDTDGNQVDAYGSKINYFAGKYYLYGNSFSTTGVAFGIKSYSSIDLTTWKYEGFLFDPTSQTPCNDVGGCGRPHIVYNPTSKLYILWANAGSSGYPVATSPSPTGPFVFLTKTAAIDPSADGLQPADFAAEAFGNDGYAVYSVLNFRYPEAGSLWPPITQRLLIGRLTNDFVNTTRVAYPVQSNSSDLIDNEAESPDLFIRNGQYYVSASNTCGYCNSSIGLIYRAPAIEGPWTRQIISGDSCAGQVEGVLSLVDPVTNTTTFVWHSTSVPGGPRIGFGGHIFQPLQFEADGSVKPLDCTPKAVFGPIAYTVGQGANATGAALIATNGSPTLAAYDYVCDSEQWTLYQTWENSKSGTLRNVSVNVARSVQTQPLAITVFRFSNISALISPGYKFETLGTAAFNASSMSYTFDQVSVKLNSTVAAGDMLGFSFGGAMDYLPYCHLEYQRPKKGDKNVLLQQGAGQNSWRGIDGKTSVVYERLGRGMKFQVHVD